MNKPTPIISQSHDRIVLDLRPLRIPEIPMLGWYHYSHAQQGLDEHAHPGTMEICYLAKGSQLYRVGRRDYLLRGGDVFMTFPDEQHSSGEMPQEKGMLYWVQIILPRRGARFLNCAPEDSQKLVAELLAIKHRHFEGDPALQTLLDEIIAAATANRNPLKKIAVTAKLIEFLLKVLECSRRNSRSALSQPITQLLRHIEANTEERLSIGELAAKMGLSVSRFKTRFKHETGIPPADYVQRCKITASKTLLAGRRHTITDIAFRLNFSSSQYFATVFKRYTGRSPRTWMRPSPNEKTTGNR